MAIPGCYNDVYVNSFFPRTARLWHVFPVECFHLIYDLNDLNSLVNRHLSLSQYVLSFCLLTILSVCGATGSPWLSAGGPVDTRRRFSVYKTHIGRRRRLIDVS